MAFILSIKVQQRVKSLSRVYLQKSIRYTQVHVLNSITSFNSGKYCDHATWITLKYNDLIYRCHICIHVDLINTVRNTLKTHTSPYMYTLE